MADTFKKLREAKRNINAGADEVCGKVTGPTLSLLLDDLLMDGVFNEGEMEQVKEEFRMRAEKARAVIDMTRKKGNAASDKLIARLQQRDPSLFQDLGLVA